MRRSLSFVMVFILLFSMPFYAATAALPKIIDIDYDAWDDAQDYAENAAYQNGSPVETSLDSLEVTAGDELRIYLHAGLFTGENGGPASDSSDGVTLSQLRSGSVTVASKVKVGSAICKDISLDYDKNAKNLSLPVEEGTSYIKIEFVEHFVSVGKQDFDFTIHLRVKGKSRSETEIRIAGTMENPVITVDEGYDSVNLEEGHVAEAVASVRNCRVEMGNGFSVTTNLVKDNKYYGVAVNESRSKQDIELFAQYSALEQMIYIDQVNLEVPGQVYAFKLPSTYHVYNEAGEYLGSTENMLPYSGKYYLSSRQIDGFNIT